MAEEFPGVISLNVGGRLFTTLLSTLTKESDSMLAAMFSGRHPVSKDQDGRYFIDADGDTFAHILNYLRFGKLPPATVALDVYEYSNYFGIQGLTDLLSKYENVVYDRYIDKMRPMYPQLNEILDYIYENAQNLLLEDNRININLPLQRASSIGHYMHGFYIQLPKEDSYAFHLTRILTAELRKRGYQATVVDSGDCIQVTWVFNNRSSK